MTRLGSQASLSTEELSFLTSSPSGQPAGFVVRAIPLPLIDESDRLRLREPPYPNIEELADAIRLDGQSTPLFVRPFPGPERYELISGYRRRAALALIEAPTALARIYTNLSDADAYRLAVSENADRSALTDWERATACARMRADDVPLDEIARRFHWNNRRTVEHHLRVEREARPLLRQALQLGTLSVSHALALLKAFAVQSEITPEIQDAAVTLAVTQQTSVAKVPSLVRGLLQPPKDPGTSESDDWHVSELKNGTLQFRGRASSTDPEQLADLADKVAALLRRLRAQHRKLLADSGTDSEETA